MASTGYLSKGVAMVMKSVCTPRHEVPSERYFFVGVGVPSYTVSEHFKYGFQYCKTYCNLCT